MNREQYESLKATDIKAIAKTRGIKYAQSKKKEELIDLMVAMDEEEESKEESTSEEAGTDRKSVV